MKKSIMAGILIVLGLAVMSVPLYFKLAGSQKSNEMVERFEQMTEQETENGHEEKEENGQENTEATLSQEDADTLSGEKVIGLIEIEALGIKYAVLEGTGSSELSCGIGHITDTAGIGETGNCVLAGHNGSRYGTFFTDLKTLNAGDVVKLTDKKGNVFLYEVESMEVIDPYDNSVKNQGEETVLTLITCENKGTMRLAVRCTYSGQPE